MAAPIVSHASRSPSMQWDAGSKPSERPRRVVGATVPTGSPWGQFSPSSARLAALRTLVLTPFGCRAAAFPSMGAPRSNLRVTPSSSYNPSMPEHLEVTRAAQRRYMRTTDVAACLEISRQRVDQLGEGRLPRLHTDRRPSDVEA